MIIQDVPRRNGLRIELSALSVLWQAEDTKMSDTGLRVRDVERCKHKVELWLGCELVSVGST